MDAIIKKNIQVYSAFAFLTLTKEEERKELKEFIDSDFQLYEEDIINDRIKFYLKKIHIIDEDEHLTTKGEKFRQTGLLPVKYQGKYKIYYVQNEPLLEGNRILYVEPSSPRPIDTQQVSRPTVNFKQDILFLLEYEQIQLKTLEINNNIINLELEIRLKDKQITHAYFKANSDRHPFKQKGKGKDLLEKNYAEQWQIEPVIKFFKETIKQKLSAEYDAENNVLRIFFSEIENDSEAIEKFIFSHELKDKDYEIFIKHIDLYPLTDDDARKWREKLAEIYLSRDYYIKDDLISELAKPQFENIIDEKFDIEDIIKEDDTLKWHFYAPKDLNPNIPENLISDQLTLSKREKLSLDNLITKLHLKEKYAAVLYYDKYVQNPWQKRAVALFLDEIEAANKIVITQKMGDYNIFEDKNIDVFDLSDVFNNPKGEHDRLLIAFSGNNLTVWKFTNSIDFLRFPKRNFDENTLAEVKTNVTFIRLRDPEKNAPETLLDFLKSKIG